MREALEGFVIKMKARARANYRVDVLRFGIQSCWVKSKPPKVPPILRDEIGES